MKGWALQKRSILRHMILATAIRTRNVKKERELSQDVARLTVKNQSLDVHIRLITMFRCIEFSNQIPRVVRQSILVMVQQMKLDGFNSKCLLCSKAIMPLSARCISFYFWSGAMECSAGKETWIWLERKTVFVVYAQQKEKWTLIQWRLAADTIHIMPI